MEILTSTPEETKRVALNLVRGLKAGDVLALYGDLGSGKTTFVQGLAEGLKINARVQSPTFVLIRHYTGEDYLNIKKINHIDLYRVAESRQVLDLGVLEMLTEPGSISVIEWPELLEQYLPPNTRKLKFETIDEKTRKITY